MKIFDGCYIEYGILGLAWPSNNDRGTHELIATLKKGRVERYEYAIDGRDACKIIDCTFECKWGGGKPSDGPED